jgi:hypothetical protein
MDQTDACSGVVAMHDLLLTRPWWRKKRWAFALAVWLIAVYPLGYGPAFAHYWQSGDPAYSEAFSAVYRPMQALHNDGPAPVRDAIDGYLGLWMPEGWNEPWICVLGLTEVAGSSESAEDTLSDAPQ